MALRWRIIRYYLPYWPTITIALILMAGTIGLNLLKPWPTAWIIDAVLPQTGGTVPFPGVDLPAWALSIPQAVLAAALAVVGIYTLSGVLSLVHDLLLLRVGLRALLQLRTQLYNYLQRLPLIFHDQHRSGDSTFRVAYDAQAVQTFFNRGFSTIVNSVATLTMTFVIMWQMDAKLALVSFAVVPFLWGTIYVFAERIRRQTRVFQEEESDLLSQATESFNSIRIVHAFGREDHETREFEKEATASFSANMQLSLTNALSTFIVGVIMGCGLAVVLYFGADAVIEGRLKVGELFVFLSYLAMLYHPLEQLSYTAWALEGALAGMQRVFEILDVEDAVPENPEATELSPGSGHVQLEAVSFGYEDQHPVLHQVSLEAKQGETIAIVGGTGSGKTTILSLIPRFFDPQSGRVILDGNDVRDATKRSVRQQVSFVLQETLLLSGTIHDNIAYGRLGATHAEVMEAARQAQADEFIRQLPQGYQTEVGERGVRLSGGQRQRIGIARAFLKGAPILLLDEPTSALDLETEAQIMETLHDLMQRQTTIIVTHRLQTIHGVDRIYVLENGRIVETGSGEALLKKNGAYARLYQQADHDSPTS